MTADWFTEELLRRVVREEVLAALEFRSTSKTEVYAVNNRDRKDAVMAAFNTGARWTELSLAAYLSDTHVSPDDRKWATATWCKTIRELVARGKLESVKVGNKAAYLTVVDKE